MVIDVTSFVKLNVADTCSIWNLLSSETLQRAAFGAGCSFCITEYVRYECLVKKRTDLDFAQAELRRRLLLATSSKQIEIYSIALDDLLEIEVLESRRRLGRGELTTIAFAKTTRQATLSDDKAARRLAAEVLGPQSAQWTPQLVGWLYYTRRFSDHECQTVISELSAFGRSLSPHLDTAYHSALHARRLEGNSGG